jgi:DNA-binding winged helix-turn-helix (wHTH) protein
MVVYRRPAPRRELLTQIADLGIFVVEHPRDGGFGAVAASTGADVALVIAADEADTALVAELASRSSRAILVCTPDGADGRPYLAAGAHRCVGEGEFTASAPRLLAEAAAEARSRRQAGPSRERFAFAGVAFDPSVPSLSRGARSRVLSRSERAVLLRLAEGGGYPVATAELESVATPAGLSMRPGFLKATILRLRRKLQDLGCDEQAIRTVRGFGYALSGENPAG